MVAAFVSVASVSSGVVTVHADTDLRISAEESGSVSGGVSTGINGDDTCGAAKDFSEVDRLVEEAEKEGIVSAGNSEDAGALYGASEETGEDEDTKDMIPMYRLYHSHVKEHLYTSDLNEKDTLVKRGWTYEGIGWYAPKEGKDVYRLVNLFTSDHHYTASEHERDVLQTRGWKYEGICWKTADETGIPVYRQCHPALKIGAHNYTTDTHEREVLCRIGWVDENIGFYAAAKGKSLAQIEKELWEEIAGVDGSKFVYENISVDDAELLGGIICHETGTHPQGMYCVGQVVLNRLRDYRAANQQLGRNAYPSTIAEVINEPNQFMDVDDLRDCIKKYKNSAEADSYKTAFEVAVKLLQGDKTGEKLIGTMRKNVWADWYAQKLNYNHCEDPVHYGGNTFFIWK